MELNENLPKTIKKPEMQIGTAITLILIITLSAISSVVVILLVVGVALSKVSFSEAKDVFSLILVALGSLTGCALGFYFGSLKH